MRPLPAKKEGLSVSRDYFSRCRGKAAVCRLTITRTCGTWVDELARAGYRAGVYCSGMPVKEGQGVTIYHRRRYSQQSSQTRSRLFHLQRRLPARAPVVPSRTTRHRHPLAAIPYATIWQFAQSPAAARNSPRIAQTHTITTVIAMRRATPAHAWFSRSKLRKPAPILRAVGTEQP